MGLALEEARAAAAGGDVPVGAVIVHGDSVLGRGRNRREVDRDPTAHAEVVALREAARHDGIWRVLDCTLVVTLEPCPMCAGAIVNARIPRLVHGCDDPKATAVLGRCPLRSSESCGQMGRNYCNGHDQQPTVHHPD